MIVKEQGARSKPYRQVVFVCQHNSEVRKITLQIVCIHVVSSDEELGALLSARPRRAARPPRRSRYRSASRGRDSEHDSLYDNSYTGLLCGYNTFVITIVIKIFLEFNKNIRGLLRRVDALESRTVSGPGLGQGYFNFSPTNHQGESVCC